MDIASLNTVKAFRSKLKWLEERQTIIATNIANADTPNYLPKDLVAPDFNRLLRSSVRPIMLEQSNPNHLTSNQTAGVRVTKVSVGGDVAPNGNGVSLEEEMMKASEIAQQHQLTISLYNKTNDLMRLAIKKPQ